MQILSLLYDAVALVTNSSLVWPYCTLVSKKSDIKALTKYEQPTIKKDARRKSLFVFSRSYFVRALVLTYQSVISESMINKILLVLILPMTFRTAIVGKVKN